MESQPTLLIQYVFEQTLRHEALVGDMTPHKVKHEHHLRHRVPLATIQGYYPAIVTRSEFNKLRDIREKRSKERPVRGVYPVRNIIAKIGCCGQCGGAISLSNKSKRIKYLVCHTGNEGAGCIAKPINYWEVEHTLITRLSTIFTDKLDNFDAFQKKLVIDFIELSQNKPIDASKINDILKALIRQIIVFQEQGHLKIFWQHKGGAFVRHAFAPKS